MLTDRYEQALSTASPAARDAYMEGVDGLFSAYRDPEIAFERAIAEDANFALAHIGLARSLQLCGKMPQARTAAISARELCKTSTPRERAHVETIALMLEGSSPAALTLLQEHLREFPRDALVLSLALGAFGLFAFSGRADHEAAKLALCNSVATHYGDDWWFLTFHGWSHTEAGNLETGKEITERAMRLRRENAHGAHALSHSYFERGHTDGGINFLEEWLPDYAPSGLLHAHLAWHLALLKLEIGDIDSVMALYEQSIGPAVSQAPPILVISDGASLFWRLRLLDARAQPPVSELTDYVHEFLSHATHPFIDVHCVMAAALANDQSLFEKRTAELEKMLSEGKLAAGDLISDLCRILQAFALDNYKQVIGILSSRLQDVVCFGGSKAQREVFEDTLIVAYLRDGQTEPAHELLRSRLERRPSAQDSLWLNP